MNILFFLTPKSDVVVVKEDDTLRQVLEKMEHHGYTAVPLIGKDGRYIGTVTEGDILWELHHKQFPSIKEMEELSIMEIARKRDNKAVHITTDMDGLVERALNQNFVPVVDDKNVFIGIVTRKDLISYLCRTNQVVTKEAAAN